MTTLDYPQDGRKTILVIENEDAIRNIYSQAIPMWGYDLMLAEKGEEAIEMFRKNYQNIDAVLSDFNLEDMTGDEVHKRVKAIKDLPFFIITGNSHLPEVQRTLENGVKGVIPKPFDLEEIRSALEDSLESA